MSGENVIRGRPDFVDHDFGQTHAKDFPKYVYSTSRQGMLVHKVATVRFYWYDAAYDHLVRYQTPKIIAECVCGQSFFIHLPNDRRKFRASFCEVPKPDAVLCGACHGEPRPFGKHGKPPCSKEQAKVRLGCVVRGKAAPAEAP